MYIRVIIQLLDLVIVDLKNSTDLGGWYTKAVTNKQYLIHNKAGPLEEKPG